MASRAPTNQQPYRSSAALSLASVALAGCIGAPGMRMQLPPTISASSAVDAGPSASAGMHDRVSTPAPTPVSVRDISAELIQATRRSDATTASDVARLLADADRGYRVGAGDVLQIVVWDHPELAGASGPHTSAPARPADAPIGFIVDPDGTLQFPYVGTVHAAGRTVGDIRALLAARLAQWFRTPQVTVRVASFRSKRIYVEGEVREPGSYALNDTRTTLYDAIGRAGGFSAQADQSRVFIVRDGNEVRLDLSGAVRAEPDPERIALRDGDRLRVASRDDAAVYVLGEVNKPGRAMPSRNGRLTLSDALAQAGNMNQSTANAAQLYVIRGSAGPAPEIYRLDATSPVALVLANRFELEPQDIVYIDGGSLVRIHRVLSLLMPAINTGLAASLATK
ncbi:polysaccharide biosynthesis/export family protein [Burkholderia stabilis]|uniref:polysaccharide biosynthesis/export family protein n=1 Tax=Burkholderia stabilis TaxID=95485 RepID=UPI0009F70362|nr:polysaccharide biosynthesis/export family protein [Burkholderia stabilis]GAU03434.1 sugar ABC transporter substrate-binding protein [Burkholderia stabilis]